MIFMTLAVVTVVVGLFSVLTDWFVNLIGLFCTGSCGFVFFGLWVDWFVWLRLLCLPLVVVACALWLLLGWCIVSIGVMFKFCSC